MHASSRIATLASSLTAIVALTTSAHQVHASPLDEVKSVLETAWSGQPHRTWEASPGHRIERIHHTSMGTWGARPVDLAVPVLDHGLAPALPTESAATPGTAVIYGVGRPGTWNRPWATGSGTNPSDDALAAMIQGGAGDVLLSQQSASGPQRFNQIIAEFLSKPEVAAWFQGKLGATIASWMLPTFRSQMESWGDWATVNGAWTDKVLAQLAAAAHAGRQVKIVIADQHAANEYSSSGAEAALAAVMKHWPPSSSTLERKQRSCNLQVAYLRSSHDDPQYPAAWIKSTDPALPPGNHVKMVIVDPGTNDAAMYVGSQNGDAHELAEHGYFVFDRPAVDDMMGQYWTSAWRYSGGTEGLAVHRPKDCIIPSGQPATDVRGQASFTTGGANGGAGSVGPAAFRAPNGVAFTPDALHLLVADSGNGRVIDLNSSLILGQPDRTTAVTSATAGDNLGLVAEGMRVSIGAASALAISDTARNRVLVENPGVGGFWLGQVADDTSTAGTARTALRGPVGVWTDGTRVIVADTGNHRVLIWNTLPTANGAPADVVLGQTGFDQNAPAATAAGMKDPRGVYFDGTRLYVADTGHHRVLVWNALPTASGRAADFAIGQDSLSSLGAATSATGLRRPTAIAVAGDALFVSDTGNHRVLVYSPIPTGSGASAAHVLGQTAMDTAVGATTRTGLDDPQDITVGANGDLAVADRGNHRVLWYALNL